MFKNVKLVCLLPPPTWMVLISIQPPFMVAEKEGVEMACGKITLNRNLQLESHL